MKPVCETDAVKGRFDAVLFDAGGVLVLLAWLAYWMWGRRQTLKGSEDTAELPAAA